MRKPRPKTSTPDIAPLTRAVCGLFEFLDDIQFWIKDVDGRYLWVNRGFLLNYALERPQQVIGKTDYDLSPPHLADQYTLDDKRVLRGESISARVELVGRFDHSAAWSVTHKLPIRDARGKICGTTGFTRREREGTPQVDVHDSALGRVIALLRGDCAHNWTNAELARHANLSIRAFERKFRASFRVSPHDYLRRMRVRLATHALVYTGAPLSQVAMEHGFADQSHFTREFRREIKITPGEYRRRFKS
jgi:AraC-like DNA-binding protein